MINLYIPSKNSSSDFQDQLAALGLFVTHKNAEVWVDGTPEQEAAAQALASTYDFSAGVIKDRQAVFASAIQDHLDAAAQKAGYDDIVSASSYAGYTNPYQAEGQSFLTWRGAVWEYAYTQMQAVVAGTRTEPTVDELIAELPVRV